MAGLHRPAEHELVKNAQERLFQTREIARKGELGRTQGHGQIRCELAGEMKHATTTPINPMHANSQRPERLVVWNNIEPGFPTAPR